MNRKKPDGWLAPSLQHKVDCHLKTIRLVHTILPVLRTTLEVAQFDLQKIRHPEIEGKEYQQGPQLGFWNVREYVLARDGHPCQWCRGLSSESPLCECASDLWVHHQAYTQPLVIALVSQWWPGGERLTWMRVLGGVVGFLGVGILVGPAALSTGESTLFLLGAFAVLAGAISYAFGALLAHHLLAGAPELLHEPMGINAIGGLALVLIGIFVTGKKTEQRTLTPSATKTIVREE